MNISASLRLALLTLSVTLALATGGAVHAADSAPKKKAAKSAKSTKAGMKKVSMDVKGEHANFASWKEVGSFIDMMVTRHGFERAALEAVMNQTRLVDTAVQLMKPAPPGKPKNWLAYRARFVEPLRINAGVQFWNTWAAELRRAEEEYGVPAEIIVGIIGVETIYGRNTGSFRVMDAVTSLAYAYPDTPNRTARMAMFRDELESTLLYAREMQIDPFSLLGSYAGAIGLPQFMPSNVRRLAVDFDKDGKIDLRASPADAIGSVANFLVHHGWNTGTPYAFPATVSLTDGEGRAEWQRFIGQGLEAKFPLSELRAGGVTPAENTPPDLLYSLVDLQNGAEATEYWLGSANFFAITQYNRSYFYAMSVIDLGRAIRMAREK